MKFKVGDTIESVNQTKSVPRWATGIIVRAWSALHGAEPAYEIEFSVRGTSLIRLRYENEIAAVGRSGQGPQPSSFAQAVAAINAQQQGQQQPQQAAIPQAQVNPNLMPRGYAGTRVVVKACECGSERVGSDRHSSWCPKSN